MRRCDPSASSHEVRKGFIHTQSGALHVAAHVREAGEIQQALDRSVFAELAVQNGKYHVQGDCFAVLAIENEQSVHALVR